MRPHLLLGIAIAATVIFWLDRQCVLNLVTLLLPPATTLVDGPYMGAFFAWPVVLRITRLVFST